MKVYYLWGTLCLIFFRVGWAKPVRINVEFLIAAAGTKLNMTFYESVPAQREALRYVYSQ